MVDREEFKHTDLGYKRRASGELRKRWIRMPKSPMVFVPGSVEFENKMRAISGELGYEELVEVTRKDRMTNESHQKGGGHFKEMSNKQMGGAMDAK